MDTIIRSDTRYFVIAGPNKVFQYMSGDFGTVSDPHNLLGFRELKEAIRAQEYSVDRYHFGEIIRGFTTLTKTEEISSTRINDDIRINALSKLTTVEKKLLGLGG